MTEPFFVDLDRLTSFARRLDESCLRVESAAALLAAAGTLGVAVLDDACREFRERRRTGLTRLGADLRRITEGLAASAAAYASADDRLAAGLGRTRTVAASGGGEDPDTAEDRL